MAWNLHSGSFASAVPTKTMVSITTITTAQKAGEKTLNSHGFLFTIAIFHFIPIVHLSSAETPLRRAGALATGSEFA
jgi:hypothetical protein